VTALLRPIWQTAPGVANLEPGHLHVWRVDLDLPANGISPPLRAFDERDERRAARFRFPIHRHRFLAGQFFLRWVLSRYLKTPLDTIEFGRTELGKPFLQSPGPALQFSYSSSRNLGLLGIYADGPVGVDIEYVDAYIEHLQLANVCFTKPEAAVLSKASPADVPRLFARIWTAKEAYLKGLGVGLRISPACITVHLEEERLEPELPEGSDASSWTLRQFETAENVLASACVLGPLRGLQYFEGACW
jgi:4'-phosphopantetheinyl transferase